jgi:hypothetical protein
MKTSPILILLLLIITTSCAISDIEDFVVGENFINDKTGILMLDTLTLQSSVVKYDSITSNSSGRLLVGSNYNSFSGYKKSDAYMEMIFEDNINYTDFVYDSLSLILNYDTYSFGDTTQIQTLNVYQLDEEMATDENDYLYTTSHFAQKSTPLGSINLKPSPNSHKEIRIRLSDRLGTNISRMLMEENDTLTTSTLFKEYFKGLVIRSQSEVKGAVFGIRTADLEETVVSNSNTETTTVTETKPEIRLYYHLKVNPNDIKDLYYTFSFNSEGVYYNQITANTSNTMLEGLSNEDNERSSKFTNQQVMVQSGIQVFSKFKVPYVDNLLWIGKNSAFIGANLRLYPIKGTYKNSANLPDSLFVYTVDRKNHLTGQLTLPGSESYAYGTLNVIKDVEETVFYEIDISSFIDTELKEELETNRALMIGFGSTTTQKTAGHILFGASNSGQYSPKLNVYYYHN